MSWAAPLVSPSARRRSSLVKFPQPPNKPSSVSPCPCWERGISFPSVVENVCVSNSSRHTLIGDSEERDRESGTARDRDRMWYVRETGRIDGPGLNGVAGEETAEGRDRERS